VRVWHGLASGHDGSRTLLRAAQRLGIGPLRVAWVQALVKLLKHKRARRERHRIELGRQSVQVLARNVLWSSDENVLLRDEQGEVRTHVVRETLAPKTLAIAIGPPATAEDLIALWETAARERGTLPLVIAIDNSGPGRSKKVKAWLRANKVVALFNVPHVPQHNAFVERTMGELECAVDGRRAREAARPNAIDCGCGRAPAQLRSRAAPHAAPVCASCAPTRQERVACLLAEWASAAWELNANTPRPKFGGLTADELDRIAPEAEDRVRRARFYQDVCSALAEAAAEHPHGRARRRAEREAIYSTLEQHRLLTRTRGGQPLSRPSKRKGIS
jgi:hypothetical protein